MKLTGNLDCDRFDYAARCVSRLGQSGSLVFDIGAGAGAMRVPIESAGHRYAGFDLVPEAPEVRRWDLEEPLPLNERADVVLMLEVIEHLWNPKKCLDHVSAVLREGGHLVLTTPNPRWSRGRFDLLIRHEMSCFTEQDLELNHHVFTSWPHVIGRLLASSGFEVTEYVTLESRLEWPNRPLTPSYPARVVKHLLSRLIEARDPAAKGMGYGVVAVKNSAVAGGAGGTRAAPLSASNVRNPSDLFLFFEEPELDRWLPFDRHPRRIVRRILRGPSQIGGVQRWFLNLCRGLDQIGVAYSVNDYDLIRRRDDAVAFVIGKSHVIGKIPAGVPIVFGPGVDSHPCANDFWRTAGIVHLLISCDWFAQMYGRDLPVPIPITVWPAGIDMDLWRPGPASGRGRQVIVYDKVRWERDLYEPELIEPVVAELTASGFEPVVIRYGSYKEEDYRRMLQNALAMIFLCEHETQGFAYLQALSSNVPIFAWDRGGVWKDPSYHPQRAIFGPVTSVPYFDERCGRKFATTESYRRGLREFLGKAGSGEFRPRAYIADALELGASARRFTEIAAGIRASRSV